MAKLRILKMEAEQIINSDAYQEFLAASLELKKYFKVDCCEPQEVSKKFKAALLGYRDFLDSNDIKMPKPIYPFLKESKPTWKYIDCKVSSHNYYGTIDNQEWVYKK